MEEEFHNHMRIPWHDYTRKSIGRPITEASLSEKASIIGRTGIMLLSCGTGAWRVRSSMNTLARELGITCTADIGLLSIEYTCIDGDVYKRQSSISPASHACVNFGSIGSFPSTGMLNFSEISSIWLSPNTLISLPQSGHLM